MKTTVVTSCSAAGWEKYGQRFVRTFREYWPLNVELLLFSEDLKDALPLSAPFLDRHKDNPRAHGRERKGTDKGWTPKKVAEGYNFRYDAFRFSKKVFAIQQAARRTGRGRLFWVDADVVTFEPIPLTLFDETLPEVFALSCLDRGTYHSECGYVGYNLDHPETLPFIEAFAGLYESETVFNLEEWHDSWVFDWLRRARNVPTHCIAHCSRHQPFINSPLGRYMDHCKGDSKNNGRSDIKHMVAGHNHPYWTRAA